MAAKTQVNPLSTGMSGFWPASTRGWASSRAGLHSILGLVLLVNIIEVFLETNFPVAVNLSLREDLIETFRLIEGHMSFSGQEHVWNVSALIYSIYYFVAFPAMLLGHALHLGYRRAGLGDYRCFTYAVLLNYAVCLVFFLFVPLPERWTVASTGAVLLSDQISPILIDLVRPMSGINNCFPSMHVSLTGIALISSFWTRSPFRHLIAVSGVGIITSTFVLGIHWLPDIIGGLACGIGSYCTVRHLHAFGLGADVRSGTWTTWERDADMPGTGIDGSEFAPAVTRPGGTTGQAAARLSGRPDPGLERPEERPAVDAAPHSAIRHAGFDAAAPSHPPLADATASRWDAPAHESDLFISYSSKNRHQARLLVDSLARQRYFTWLDKERVHAGEFYAKKITSAIKRSRAVIVILSRESIQSQNVITELQLAHKNHKSILPIIYGLDEDFMDGHLPDDLEYLLAQSQYLAFERVVDDPGPLVESLRALGIKAEEAGGHHRHHTGGNS